MRTRRARPWWIVSKAPSITNNFELLFQPIVRLQDGRCTGLEALTRFSLEPVQGPERWFADADSIGLRAELEIATARAALTQFDRAAPDCYLSLNMSPQVLPSSGHLVRQADGNRLVIEVTEHAVIEDYEALNSSLGGLRDSGVRLAVDDAGAGFASLRHALHLSPDFIKLDLSLTHGIESDPTRRALASGLVGFASELGAAIVAEGIETPAQLRALRDLGVEYGQGYYLARPLPLEQALANLPRNLTLSAP